MAAQQTLFDTLSSLQVEQKTGRLFLFCLPNRGVSRRPGEFRIRQGKTAMIQFAGEHGQSALDTLLEQSIDRVMFLDERSGNEHTHETLMAVEDILVQLNKQSQQQLEMDSELMQQVEAAMNDF